MIRFSCPHCSRAYLLPDALARLPLMCKGCGQKLDVPEPGPDDDPPQPPAKERPLEVYQPPAPEPPNEPLFAADTSSKIDFDIVPPAKPPLTKPAVLPPLAAPSPNGRRAAGIAADVVVGLLLAVGGAFLGEIVTQKATVEIFPAATKQMPPVDLLVWVGCVLCPVLVYLLLANRRKSLGGWLWRRT